MKARISVCIPTYNRPGLLQEALQSVLHQNHGSIEVVVGDDSTNRETAQLVRQYDAEGVPIRYLNNDPPLGQAKNVDRCFQKAEGHVLVLLHDDDRLLPDALETLLACFEDHPGVVAAFGKQQTIGPDGAVRQEATQGLNQGYYRTAEYEGRQPSSLRAAIIQQFPNDGYMVRAEAAKKVGYDLPGAGDACDFAFGVELAQKTNGDFYYTDTYVSQYRKSKESVVRGEGYADTAYRSFKLVTEELGSNVKDDPYVKRWLRERSAVAIMMAAQNGYPRDGFRWFFGPHHRHRIASPGGIRRLVHLIYSSLTT